MHKLAMLVLYDGLDFQIENLKIQMALSEDNAEVQDLNMKLAKLIAVKNEQYKNQVTPEQLFKTVVDILGASAVLKFEEFNIIGSKLWSTIGSKLFK